MDTVWSSSGKVHEFVGKLKAMNESCNGSMWLRQSYTCSSRLRSSCHSLTFFSQTDHRTIQSPGQCPDRDGPAWEVMLTSEFRVWQLSIIGSLLLRIRENNEIYAPRKFGCIRCTVTKPPDSETAGRAGADNLFE